MTTNPFGKLHVDFDDDEHTTAVQKTQFATPLFLEPEVKKRKKVRPEEKKKLEEERQKQQQDESEGNFYIF